MKSQYLYKTFIAPRSKDPNRQNQEAVLNWLLVGSLGLTLMAFLNVLVSLVFLGESYLKGRLTVIVGLFLFFALLLGLSRRKGQQTLPALVLISIFFASAFMVVYRWDILDPGGILLFGLVIVMAGILLSARSSLYAAVAISSIVVGLEYAKAHHHWAPDLSWMHRSSRYADALFFTAVYATLALSSWLFNQRMETALIRAKRSEKALQRQKELLEVKVAKRTRELEAAQLEKVQEFYRFAELGHLSTALFHDLANSLMSVSIDIEGLKAGQPSDLLARIQENIHYIDGVVQRVRQQIQGQAKRELFDVADEINEIIRLLSHSPGKSDVHIELQVLADKPIEYRGDLTRFRQIIINLLSNAVEASRSIPKGQPQDVQVALERSPDWLTIAVIDHGSGVSPSLQTKIFEPFYSTKDKGAGIGLFIVKKVTEEDCKGTISLTSNKQSGTIFTVKLPLRRS